MRLYFFPRLDDPSNSSTAESPRMIAFFDSLVRRDVEDASSSSDDDSTRYYFSRVFSYNKNFKLIVILDVTTDLSG